MPWSKFTFPNLLLQRDDYCIHAAHEHLDDAFLAGLFSFEKIKAVKPVTKVKGKVNNWQTWAIYWHHFNQRAALGAISKPPWKDNTLIHARYVNFFDRENASFENVEFILKKYSTVLQLLRGMPTCWRIGLWIMKTFSRKSGNWSSNKASKPNEDKSSSISFAWM